MKKPVEVAAYIVPACLEMRKLALDANLPLLAYLLEMTSLEATNVQLRLMADDLNGEHDERTVLAKTHKRIA